MSFQDINMSANLIRDVFNIIFIYIAKQTIGAKVYSREGNSPDLLIRF